MDEYTIIRQDYRNFTTLPEDFRRNAISSKEALAECITQVIYRKGLNDESLAIMKAFCREVNKGSSIKYSLKKDRGSVKIMMRKKGHFNIIRK